MSSVVEYVDSFGAIHGVVTVLWFLGSNVASDFPLTDNGALDGLIVGTNYPGIVAFTAPAGVSLTTAAPLYGNLPTGLSVTASGQNILVTGTPQVAGYFDVWFQTTSLTNQRAYIYSRISTVIPSAALAVVGWAYAPYVPGVSTVYSFPLPNAIVSGAYYAPGIQLVAANGSGLATQAWTSNPTFPYHGLLLSGTTGGGVISGTVTTQFSPNPQLFDFTVTDSTGTATAFQIPFTSQTSGLTIVPPYTISATSGVSFSQTLTGVGSVNLPYSFSISPLSANQLPSGLGLNNASPTTATVSGLTNASGFSKLVIIRITDISGAYADFTYAVTVSAGLTLKTGIDTTNTLSLSILGYVAAGNVDSISPRPNASFLVYATGVVSTSIGQVGASVNYPGITATVQSLNAGTAVIRLSGPGFTTPAVPLTPSSPPTITALALTVTDSGVSVTQTFNWYLYNDGGTLLVTAGNNFPTELLNPTSTVVITPPPPPPTPGSQTQNVSANSTGNYSHSNEWERPISNLVRTTPNATNFAHLGQQFTVNNFGFNIPGNATITGITVSLNYWLSQSGSGGYWATAQLVSGGAIGTPKSFARQRVHVPDYVVAGRGLRPVGRVAHPGHHQQLELRVRVPDLLRHRPPVHRRLDDHGQLHDIRT